MQAVAEYLAEYASKAQVHTKEIKQVIREVSAKVTETNPVLSLVQRMFNKFFARLAFILLHYLRVDCREYKDQKKGYNVSNEGDVRAKGKSLLEKYMQRTDTTLGQPVLHSVSFEFATNYDFTMLTKIKRRQDKTPSRVAKYGPILKTGIVPRSSSTNHSSPMSRNCYTSSRCRIRL
ncbi:hypothetical protein AC578_9949 [Pseudocercospora eumusae]|uniref:Uncharacterized protein n=1 Tax=Pseudocercospora eumusae TaxID=321146 RepID=A0A139H091_9PEZI|nr:hypothetical protein AC578_9949 [Pseudocercospora eumusae]